MNESIRTFVQNALKEGEKEFLRQYGIHETHGQNDGIINSIKDIRNISQQILRHIEERIYQVDWAEEEQVRAFCESLDQKLEEKNIKQRFLRAYSRTYHEKPHQKWKEFIHWFSEFRQTKKGEILKFVASVQQQPVQEMSKPGFSKTTNVNSEFRRKSKYS